MRNDKGEKVEFVCQEDLGGGLKSDCWQIVSFLNSEF